MTLPPYISSTGFEPVEPAPTGALYTIAGVPFSLKLVQLAVLKSHRAARVAGYHRIRHVGDELGRAFDLRQDGSRRGGQKQTIKNEYGLHLET